MNSPRASAWSRRAFVRGLAVTAGLGALTPRTVTAEPPPETTRLRLHKMAGICIAPQYVAEELL
jgi:NitT/TauT family transport system substrate-binding protein